MQSLRDNWDGVDVFLLRADFIAILTVLIILLKGIRKGGFAEFTFVLACV